jgi:hypothetical protein
MEIYARRGHKVIYNNPNAGYAYEQVRARDRLCPGGAYTVERTHVGEYRTDVYLAEVPGIAFNSTLFSDAPGQRK